MSTRELKPQIYYLIRRKWYDQLIRLCDNHLSKKGKEPTLLFWKAFAAGMSGNIQDCLRQLEAFPTKRDLQYPISLALLYFHKQSPSVDYEAIDTVSSELSVAEDLAKEAGLCLAARFSQFTGDCDLALRLTRKVLAATRGEPPSTPFELEASCCEFWTNFQPASQALASGTTKDIRELMKKIEDLVRGRMEQAELDLLMLWVRLKLLLKQTSEGLNILNQIIAMYPWFLAALSEKTLILAASREWDQALDTAQRVLDVEADNLDALQVVAVHAFTQESQPHDALQKLEDYDRCVIAKESSSTMASSFAAVLFSNICCRQPRALQICVRMLERVQKLKLRAEDESWLLTEQASIHLFQGPSQFGSAMRAYKEAAKKNPDSVTALLGMIRCQIMEGEFEDAEAQTELLTMMHSGEELGAEFSYLQALMARLGSKDMKRHLSLLNECKDLFESRGLQANATNRWSSDEGLVDYIVRSPDFIMALAVEYLNHIESAVPTAIFGQKSISNDQNSESDDVSNEAGFGSSTSSGSVGNNVEISPPVQVGIDLLRKVISQCPGLVCAYVECARCYVTLGMFEEAVRCLHSCLSLQPTCTAALVCMGKVEASRGNTAAADRALEQALSCDFTIRSVTLFRLVRVSVMAQQGRYDEAIAEMEQIIQLPEFRSGGPSSSDAAPAIVDSLGTGFGIQAPVAVANVAVVSTNFSDSFRLVDDDRVGAFVTLSALYGKVKRSKEANKVLSEAKVMFAGTPQEVLVLVAASQLAVEKKDFDSAVRMLDKISDDSPTFTRAQLIKAEILLNHNRDQEGYTQCFQQLVERDPSSKNYALLGEAYLRILNPEKAVEALEAAHRLDNTNARLRVRIGRALVATHEYHRAIDFYEQAIKQALQEGTRAAGGTGGLGKSSEAVNLSHDLAKLYVKLDRGEGSIRVLSRIIHDNYRDTTDFRQNVTTLLLLSDIYKKFNPNEVQNTLKRAYDLQKEVIAQVRSGSAAISNTEVIDEEKSILSSICEKLAASQILANEVPQAEQSFNESLQHNPENINAMLGLASLCRLRNDMEQCQLHCKKIISADPSHEQATVLLSETMFLGPDPDGAVVPLENLLRAHPNNYRALERLISLLRRAGKLEEVPALLAAASSKDKRSGAHAGFRFCSGLYARFTNDVGKAISEFNLARKDDVWGPLALTHMIEMYLNPDQDGAWEEKESGPVDEGTSENIAVADALLRELRPKAKDTQRFQVLENYCFLATKQRFQIDKAMQSFLNMLEEDQDYLPAILGMATGYMVEKNQHKARNLLKRVAKMELSTRDGEDFTKANLLLAKFHVDKSKYDLAQELCKKCLAQDRSCSQAWEILGLAMEKEMDYEHASECYEKAWKLEFEASATVGFKLAFTYLKTKKYVAAIDVCETVLNQYPDYPKIRDEILKKAQLGFRSSA